MFKPDRLRRMWRVSGAPGRRDPTTFVFVFALWMLCQGGALLMPSPSFDVIPSYALAKEVLGSLGVGENFVGSTMVANGLVLLWSMGDRSPSIRAAIAFVTAALWCAWALLLFLGGLRAGAPSGGSVWTIIVSFILFRASVPFAWEAEEN